MIDIEQVFKDMASSVQTSVTTAWPQVKEVWAQFVNTNKNLMAQVAQARILGQITDADALSYAEDEKNLLKSQLLAVEILGEAIAQGAANAAIDVFWAAVNKALGTTGL